MSWTLSEAQRYLQNWVEAEQAVATGQSYRIGSRELKRADLNHIAERISFWRAEVARLESGYTPGMRMQRFTLRDY